MAFNFLELLIRLPLPINSINQQNFPNATVVFFGIKKNEQKIISISADQLIRFQLHEVAQVGQIALLPVRPQF